MIKQTLPPVWKTGIKKTYLNELNTISSQHLLHSKSNSKRQIWFSTQVNYHTSVNPPHIPTNTVSREMSVLFPIALTFNTDKPILGAGPRNQVSRSVTHTDSIWGQRTSTGEQSHSQNGLMYWVNHSPFLIRGPYFLPCGDLPWQISPQILAPPLRMDPGEAEPGSPPFLPLFGWVSYHPSSSQSNFS